MSNFLRNLTKPAEERRQEMLSAYLDGALAPGERRRFEQQLAQDPGLQAMLEQQRLLQQALRQLPRHPVPRHFTLDPARYGRPQPQPLFQLYPALRVATALTAVFFIIAIVLDLLPAAGFPAGPVPAASQVAFEVMEVTRVITEEIIVEGELVEATRILLEIAVEEEVAAAEAVEEPATERLTVEAAESGLEAAAATAIAEAPLADMPALASPYPAAPDVMVDSVAEPEAGNGEPPAETARETIARDVEPPPLSNLRLAQIGLGAAFLILVTLLILARRRI